MSVKTLNFSPRTGAFARSLAPSVRRPIQGDSTVNRVCLVGILLVLSSCKNSPVQPVSSSDDLVREAGFRYLIAEYSFDTTLKVIFLDNITTDTTYRFLSHSNPSDELLQLFSSNNPPVKRYSELVFTPGVTDKATGQPGVLYFTSQLNWTSSNTVEYYAGDLFGPRAIDFYIFYLSKHGTSWAVDSTKGIWSS